MKLEKEITVKVNCDYKTLDDELTSKGFVIKEEYEVNDDYLIDSKLNLKKMSNLEILSKCILIRDIVEIEKELLYKYKKYDANGNILKQGKVKCPVLDTKKALEFMNMIGYKSLFKIYDKCIVYCSNKTELIVQLVNNKYIFIEMEDESQYISKKYEDIKDMINELEEYDLPYEKGNYFVKKAEIILDEDVNK